MSLVRTEPGLSAHSMEPRLACFHLAQHEVGRGSRGEGVKDMLASCSCWESCHAQGDSTPIKTRLFQKTSWAARKGGEVFLSSTQALPLPRPCT